MWRKGLNWIELGSKWARHICLNIPNGPGSLLKKRAFEPFLTHCWSQTAHCQGILGFSMGQHALPWAQNGLKTLFWACQVVWDQLWKNSCFSSRGPSGPTVSPHRARAGCPPAPPSDDWYGGLGVSLGDCEAWKPHKVGGCGRTRCPRNSVLSHIAQDTARSWFWACLTQTAHIQAIFSHFRAILST